MNVPSRDLVERESWPHQLLAAEPASQAGPQGKQFGFTELVRMLRRRKLLIILTITGVLAATFGMLKLTEPVYSSTAVVMVESETPDAGTVRLRGEVVAGDVSTGQRLVTGDTSTAPREPRCENPFRVP